MHAPVVDVRTCLLGAASVAICIRMHAPVTGVHMACCPTRHVGTAVPTQAPDWVFSLTAAAIHWLDGQQKGCLSAVSTKILARTAFPPETAPRADAPGCSSAAPTGTRPTVWTPRQRRQPASPPSRRWPAALAPPSRHWYHATASWRPPRPPAI
eukprot:177557-Chlamydomonas_euryale.AAC.3